MNPEDVIETFVSTIILGVMIVVTIQILNPGIGENLVGLLPTFIEIIVYIMVVGVIISMVFQLLDHF